MPYFFNTPEDRRAMLDAIGVARVDDLFDDIPAEIKLQRPLEVPPALSEVELERHMKQLSARNTAASESLCFLGGGSYDHFVPAVVDHIASRGEYYTSYTPYQAEASQGNLQVFFEYQTLISELTGLDVANSSLYDGGSAACEAVLMALASQPKRRRVVVAGSVHPEYREIIETYLINLDAELVTVSALDGGVSGDELAAAIDVETACVLVQQPNFFGALEDVDEIARQTHEAGAALIVAVDPISLGLLKRPGDYGADIVVAEGQSLGIPMQYGGPYLGIMACRETFIRKMPGRITGATVDRSGGRCFVLTLQTREQHIRRQKATSNICTNQGLMALRAAVYLAAMGPQGMRETAELCLQKSRYAADRLTENDRFELAFDRRTFKEFVVRDRQGRVTSLLDEAARQGVFAGVALGRWYPELDDCFLVAVTEKRTKADIDRWAECLANSEVGASAVHA
ncbi:MAG: aminomethyl-transferring glycine dehydrogenase subunit GcvPA [Planctomycetales bacterium]|nr:aminomethyl-transferring glycine dehydrogenase subunit GcvPA [Planctomycetales bacterium]